MIDKFMNEFATSCKMDPVLECEPKRASRRMASRDSEHRYGGESAKLGTPCASVVFVYPALTSHLQDGEVGFGGIG